MERNMERNLEQMFANIKAHATDAFDSTDEEDVQSWDAYEACKCILQEMIANNYDIAYMLEQIAEEAEDAE
jgi:hypothetical protein